MTHSEKLVTKVNISWKTNWNEICAWCVEHYGLPGKNYTWHAQKDDMEFIFFNEKDAIHFILRWS